MDAKKLVIYKNGRYVEVAGSGGGERYYDIELTEEQYSQMVSGSVAIENIDIPRDAPGIRFSTESSPTYVYIRKTNEDDNSSQYRLNFPTEDVEDVITSIVATYLFDEKRLVLSYEDFTLGVGEDIPTFTPTNVEFSDDMREITLTFSEDDINSMYELSKAKISFGEAFGGEVVFHLNTELNLCFMSEPLYLETGIMRLRGTQMLDEEAYATNKVLLSGPYDPRSAMTFNDYLDAYSKIEIVDVPNNQTTFDGKVFPNIFNETANLIYDYYTSGKTVIVKWTVLGIPVEATVISSDKIGTTKTFDIIMHNEYLCEYSTTEGSTSGFATVTFVKLGGGGDSFAGTETGTNSTASHGATASGTDSIAVGKAAKATKGYSLSVGNEVDNVQAGTICIGHGSRSTNDAYYDSVCIGRAGVMSATQGVAIGARSQVAGSYGIAIGAGTTSTRPYAYSNYGVAIGNGAVANSPYQVAFSHIKFICCGDLPSTGYTVPTGYTAILFDVTDGSIGIKTAGQSIDARHEDFAIIVKAEA